MATLCENPDTPISGTARSSWLPSSGALITRLRHIRQYIAQRHYRRTRRDAFQMLHSLDDATLNDIGVTRGDVMWASQLPLHCDAATELEKRRHSIRRK